MAKAQRLRCPLTAADIRQNIRDIAGVRITCGLISDTYRVADLIGGQPDVTVLEVEDYIAKPKSNGYKSLHVAVEIPVFLSDRVVQVPVELQIRTIAMDFWASLEHKIYYKYQRSVPPPIVAGADRGRRRRAPTRQEDGAAAQRSCRSEVGAGLRRRSTEPQGH